MHVPDELSRLLRHPSIIGVGGATGEMDTTGTEFDKEEHIQRLQMQGFDRKEVTRQHVVSIVLDEGAPRRLAALWRGQQTMRVFPPVRVAKD